MRGQNVENVRKRPRRQLFGGMCKTWPHFGEYHGTFWAVLVQTEISVLYIEITSIGDLGSAYACDYTVANFIEIRW